MPNSISHKSARVALPYKIKHPLGDFIKGICHVNKETEFAEYDHPWSDELVVKEFSRLPIAQGFVITIHHVTHIRRDLVGNLAPSRGGTASAKNNSDEIVDLKERLSQLEAWASQRPVKPFHGELDV